MIWNAMIIFSQRKRKTNELRELGAEDAHWKCHYSLIIKNSYGIPYYLRII